MGFEQAIELLKVQEERLSKRELHIEQVRRRFEPFYNPAMKIIKDVSK